MSAAPAFDFAHADALRQALERRTRAEVRFDDGSRALYATDASNYRQVPIGVVIPRDLEDIVETVAACREFDAPVLPRGGGTSLAGQCCNVAVVIDTSKYLNRVLDLDPQARTATVEPGCVLDTLREAAQEHQLTFGPDPSTHNHNTLGGMIGNNSCGVHSVMAGRTADNVIALEVLTYDGVRMWVGATSDEELDAIAAGDGRIAEIYAGMRALRERYGRQIEARFPEIPRRVSGYNLPALQCDEGMQVARALVGSEGTCVFVLRAILRLVPSPRERALVVLGFRDVYEAADAVPCVLEHHPIGLEGFDDCLVRYMEKKGLHPKDLELLPAGGGWLMAEFGGVDKAEACAHARKLLQRFEGASQACSATLFDDTRKAARLWAVRESGLGATARVPGEPDTHPGWEDSAVAPETLGHYTRALRGLLDDYGYGGSMYGHFGDGCVHLRIDSDLRTEAGVAQWRRFAREAADLVVAHGGSLSGEHGDGQARGELLERMFGAELVEAMREFQRLWDPRGRMNPGKVVDAYRIDQNLRIRPGLSRPSVDVVFSYPQDGGDLTRATLRCVGVGECRREGGSVMCPSFQATREEMHSTRGRARLLYEMLRGMANEDGVLRSGWRSRAVHDALDLCLACKGCKSECPVNVDVAKYKAEFMHLYYQHRPRPRTAYSMGLIYWWARAGSHAPQLINTLTSAPLLGAAVKKAAGVARQRRFPTFAQRPFTADERLPRDLSSADVLLWPDTFSNFFRPQALHAAYRLLHSIGVDAAIPERIACCARPLYAEGMLDTALRQVRTLLDVLEPAIARRLPVVGLEPSCLASLRDEIPELLPKDERAQYLKENALTLAELLQRRGFSPPRSNTAALVHMHCNHRAVMGVDSDLALLEAMFEHCSIPEPGCCGMAGPFGFDAHKYDVSLRIAERALTPAVRGAAPETIVIADGFSCSEQIAQLTLRQPVHLAEALWSSMRTRLSE